LDWLTCWTKILNHLPWTNNWVYFNYIARELCKYFKTGRKIVMILR
jgi:hypothetical protein